MLAAVNGASRPDRDPPQRHSGGKWHRRGVRMLYCRRTNADMSRTNRTHVGLGADPSPSAEPRRQHSASAEPGHFSPPVFPVPRRPTHPILGLSESCFGGDAAPVVVRRTGGSAEADGSGLWRLTFPPFGARLWLLLPVDGPWEKLRLHERPSSTRPRPVPPPLLNETPEHERRWRHTVAFQSYVQQSVWSFTWINSHLKCDGHGHVLWPKNDLETIVTICSPNVHSHVHYFGHKSLIVKTMFFMKPWTEVLCNGMNIVN